jgi:tripartite-type tricarboxylate transporter receptor subunit TctC
MQKIHFRNQGETVPVNMEEEEAKREIRADIKRRVEAMREAGMT